MSALETYLKAIIDTKGLLHSQSVATTRRYINLTKIEDMRAAIDRITDPALLRALWECGLTAELQRMVLAQLDKLTEVKK